MLHSIVLASISFAVTLALIWLLLHPRLARFALDRPNARSLHASSVPRTGGIAVFAGLLAGWALSGPPSGWSLAGTAALLALVSLLDDVRQLPIVVRLAAHLVAAGFAVLLVLGPDARAVWMLAAIVATAWMTNLYNFMDGADGLAGGMSLFGFSCYAFAAWEAGHAAFACANLTIAASAAAFLIFNFHPARIFLGDVGSIPLGFLAGALGLAGWAEGSWPASFPLLVFSPFIVDASATLARRMLAGDRFWEPHREHYYQKLVRLGWGHRRTALVAYALMAAAGAFGWLARDLDPAGQTVALALMLLLYAGLIAAVEVRWRRAGLQGGA